MVTDKTSKSLFHNINLGKWILIFFICLFLVIVVFWKINWQRSIQSQQATRIFLQDVIESINGDTDYYRGYCDEKTLKDIEADSDKITGNYEITVSDSDSYLIRYKILFDHKDILSITITGWRSGDYKIILWSIRDRN